MQPDQRLEVFLPKLRAQLLRNGMSAEAADFVCKGITVGAQQPAITTLEQYQDAWTICYAAEQILTTLEDGSEAAAWCSALAISIIDYEVGYIKRHGHAPLHAGPPETEGQTGNA
jgi:hypothetical protein